MKIIIFCFIAFILISCNINNSPNINTSVIVEDYFITADSFSLPFYNIWDVNEKRALFLGYNNHLHSIDVFELENRCFFQRIFLENAGPNQISKPVSIFYLNNDSIFIAEQLSVKLFSIRNGVIKKFDPYRAKGYNFQEIGELYNYTNFPIIFSNKSHSVYLGCNQFKDKLSKPLIVEYNLDIDSIYFLPIQYPIEMIAKNLNYGYLKQLNVSTIDSNKIFYNFSFQAGFHFLNLAEQKAKDFPCSEKTVPRVNSISGPIDNEKLNNHAIMNPHYFAPLVADNYIYQFSFDSAPLSQRNGNQSSYKDKTWSILVYNKKGNFIQRIPLNIKPIQLQSWFICNEYLYFAPHITGLEPAKQKLNDLLLMRMHIER